ILTCFKGQENKFLCIVALFSAIPEGFIHPKLSAPLIQAQIAVECMTTAAACRTYNILMAEGRKVLAGLIV
ncbi:MAG: MTH938/NDUFAF3 family protein, partial [Methylophilaceae bacterium]